MAVADASVRTVIDEEYSEQAILLLQKVDTIYAPTIIWYEAGNAHVKLYRRRLITRVDA